MPSAKRPKPPAPNGIGARNCGTSALKERGKGSLNGCRRIPRLQHHPTLAKNLRPSCASSVAIYPAIIRSWTAVLTGWQPWTMTGARSPFSMSDTWTAVRPATRRTTGPSGYPSKAGGIIVAEGYAPAATLKSLRAEAGDPLGRVAFVAAFDAGNVPHVARVLRERHLSAAMVIAADNDRAMAGQEIGRNPGLIKSQQAASANGAVLMAPSFSEEELAAGFSDWNDLASHDEVRKGLVAKELEQALQKAFPLQDVRQSSVPGNGEDHGDVFDSEHEAQANDQNISSGVNTAGDYDDEETQAALVLSSGDPQKEQKTFPPMDKDPRSQ